VVSVARDRTLDNRIACRSPAAVSPNIVAQSLGAAAKQAANALVSRPVMDQSSARNRGYARVLVTLEALL